MIYIRLKLNTILVFFKYKMYNLNKSITEEQKIERKGNKQESNDRIETDRR